MDKFITRKPRTPKKKREDELLEPKSSPAAKKAKTSPAKLKSSPVASKAPVGIQLGNSTSAEDPGPSNTLSVLLNDEGWRSAVGKEFNKPYFKKLVTTYEAEKKKSVQIFPPEAEIFSAFDVTPFDKVRVVILGQDPYHDNGQGHGLCFSVKHGIQTPPSLRNMYTELIDDIPGFTRPAHGNLMHWAEQGVFLLNATLTVQAHKANSHKDWGWQEFTDAVIKAISSKKENVVFLLWGGFAKKKGKVINRMKHHVIECAHPSPLSVTKWRGCKVFSKTNAFLKKKGMPEIDWQIPAKK